MSSAATMKKRANMPRPGKPVSRRRTLSLAESDERKKLKMELARLNATIDEERRILQRVRATISAKQRRIKSLERSAAAIDHSLELALKVRKAVMDKLGIKP